MTEEQLSQLARDFKYPVTPDVARATLRRWRAERPAVIYRRVWVYAALAIIAVCLGILATPQARAGLIEFLQIGGVRLWLSAPTVTPTAMLEPTPQATPSPIPTPTLMPSLRELKGQTTLAAARQTTPFVIPFPPELGEPDLVFAQRMGERPMIILVWLDDQQPAHIRYSLHLLTCEMCVTKTEPKVIETTTVNEKPAIWASGPYMLELRNGTIAIRRLIEGNVLIWENAEVTYRLETAGTLEEARRLAESLEP